MSAHADAVYAFLLVTAVREADGRLVSRQPVYPHLMEVFGLTDPEARSARTKAVAQLASEGRVHRDAVRSQAVEILDAGTENAAVGGRRSFVLTWDGHERGYPAEDLAADIATTGEGAPARRRWSVGRNRPGMSAGDRVFLLRQGTSRGIVAAGQLVDGVIFEAEHWADPSKTSSYVWVDWDNVVASENRLDVEALLAHVPEHQWNAIYSSGQQLYPPSDGLLEAVWRLHMTSIHRGEGAWTLQPGDTLGRRSRMQQYGGAMYGGIQPSNTTPNVFVYSDPAAGSAYGYNYDGWTENGDVFLYTGEGRRGHQKIRVGNAAILNHDSDGRALRLFVADGTEPGSDARVQRYIGEFRVDPVTPYVTAEAPDEDGAPRTVLVFRLLPVGAVLQRDDDRSVTGDAPAVARAEPVDVDAAVTPAGSAEAVPLEALASSSYPVTGSTSTVAVKTEAELVARYQLHLESGGAKCCRYRLRPPGELRDLYTDLLDQTANVLYEAKGAATREAIRMALGQLLDYSRHVPGSPALSVLLPARPGDDLLSLLRDHDVSCVYEAAPGKFSHA